MFCICWGVAKCVHEIGQNQKIEPPHFRFKWQQQNNQKPAHIVLIFYGPDKELFWSRISTDQTVQKYWGLGIFHTPWHVWGVWKIAKNQSHLVKFGCGNPGILVTFWTGQENHPTFNTFNTFKQLWPWWGVGVVEKIVKPHFGIGQGNVWWVWWGYGHYWPRN